MLLLFLLLLLSIPNEIVGIDCVYSSESIEWPLENFTYDEFKMKIDSYPSYDYKDDNIDMCRIEIYVDYQFNELIINFADSFEWYQLDDAEGRLDFLITFNGSNTEGEYYNVLEYACNDQNQCDKLFLLNNIHWLKQVNYTILELNLKSLLFNNSNQTENCYTDKNNLIKCSSGVCSGKYFDYRKNYLFECHPNSETSVEVHITTSMIVNEGSLPNEIKLQEQQIIRYTCKYNRCNHQLTTDSLINITKNYFPLSSMRDALILSYQEKDFSNFNLSNQITSSTPSEQNSSSKSSIKEDILFNIANKSCYIKLNLLFYFIIIYFI